MKTILESLLLSGLLVSSVSFAANEPQTASAQSVSPATDKPAAPEHCIRDTGSRIKSRSADGCRNEPGRSYDREAIDSTGAVSVGDALRNLDSSVTVRR